MFNHEEDVFYRAIGFEDGEWDEIVEDVISACEEKDKFSEVFKMICDMGEKKPLKDLLARAFILGQIMMRQIMIGCLVGENKEAS